jgi:hypothetical protein
MKFEKFVEQVVGWSVMLFVVMFLIYLLILFIRVTWSAW